MESLKVPTQYPDKTIELLKEILEHLDSPELLNAHPWASGWMVAQACKSNPALRQQAPGRRLAFTVASVFREMAPPMPPRQGKRLDTRWGEFGLLAARYFIPFLHARPYPCSLREAWHDIDDAIQLLVFDGRTDASDQDRSVYRLVSGEPGSAPESTLSDWHRNGINRLAKVIHVRQQYGQAHGLAGTRPPAQGHPRLAASSGERRTWPRGRLAAAALAVMFLVLSSLAGAKLWQLDRLAGLVKQDAAQIRAQAGGGDFAQAGKSLVQLRTDLDALTLEAGPVRWLCPALGWLPAYGETLQALPRILDISDELVSAAEQAYQGAGPVLENMRGSGVVSLPGLTQALSQAQPQLAQAQAALERARALRAQVRLEALTPGVRELLVQDIDPVLALMGDSVTVALAFPRLMGATGEGPKTYLLLVQNEDELRPTGGFIGAAGTLVVMDGRIINLAFEDSSALDDWSKAYPPAPWQLQSYMDIPILTFRDSNWFSDYRQTVENAEYLFSLGRGHSVDGVFAFDQHALVMMLDGIGPIQVEGVSYPITAGNAIGYMRAAKIPPPAETRPQDWHRKAFINKLSGAVLNRLLGGEAIPWQAFAGVLTQALDERHLLLQLDDASMSGLLERRSWDGSIRPGPGDFLMLVDANVGYTKSNAVMQSGLVYEVDLKDPQAPVALLTVVQKNNAPESVPCAIMQDVGIEDAQDQAYAMDRCYWDYMRVYKPAGTGLLEAGPHALPAAQMMRGQEHPAQVDSLQEEIPGVQGFGTLLLVPGGQTLSTSFRFQLPRSVISPGPDRRTYSYQLKVQKQPGSLEIPLALRIHLPPGAKLLSAPEDAAWKEGYVELEAHIRTGAWIQVIFALP